MVEKKRSQSHDPRAKQNKVEASGGVDDDGVPVVVVFVNGVGYPMGVTDAVNMAHELYQIAASVSADALLMTHVASLNDETSKDMTDGQRTLRGLQFMRGYQKFRHMQLEQYQMMQQVAQASRHNPEQGE